MTLSNKTFQELSSALAPEVIEFIFNDKRWVDLMHEIVPDAIICNLGKINEDVLYELSSGIMDRIWLTTSNFNNKIK